jgi:hypothetical protein
MSTRKGRGKIINDDNNIRVDHAKCAFPLVCQLRKTAQSKSSAAAQRTTTPDKHANAAAATDTRWTAALRVVACHKQR